jgi:putative heme-binding domain-containing protein
MPEATAGVDPIALAFEGISRGRATASLNKREACIDVTRAMGLRRWSLWQISWFVTWIFCAVQAAPAAAQDHQYSAEQIQAGYRTYVGQCQLCHGFNGDGIARVNLAHQQFPRAVTDEDIRKAITNGNAAGMPPFAFKEEELDGLIAFVRSGMDQVGTSFRLGDAAHGKMLYEAGGCADCHRLAGNGPRTAPGLDDIGFVRRPGQILTSLTDPTMGTMPINRAVTIVTRDGRTLRGRRFNEDTFSVQLIDEQENVRSIAKSDIRRYDVSMTSQMPSYRGRMNDAELADLLAYLVSLKGQ